MTDSYKKALINQITVQGDTELMSASGLLDGLEGRSLHQHHGVRDRDHPG